MPLIPLYLPAIPVLMTNDGTAFVLAALEATVVRHTSLGAPVLAAVTNAIVQDEQSVFIVREDKRKITAGD